MISVDFYHKTNIWVFSGLIGLLKLLLEDYICSFLYWFGSKALWFVVDTIFIHKEFSLCMLYFSNQLYRPDLEHIKSKPIQLSGDIHREDRSLH